MSPHSHVRPGLSSSRLGAIQLGTRLGRGGEGEVFEIAGHRDLVAKIYHGRLSGERVEKLKVMQVLGRPELQQISAWPVDLIHEKGVPRGFVMPRAENARELHVLYGPKSRKQQFPDAGFAFLVQCAANVARAFAVIHDSGLVIGDVNDRLVMVSRDATVRLIDFFDTITKGLVLRCSVAGQKTWYVVYGPPSKRQWLRLGAYPEIPLGGSTGARQRARDTRAAVSDGGNPVADKKAMQISQNVADLVENYIERYASTKRSADQTARRLRKNVSDVIGDTKLSELHRRDITKCLDRIKDRGANVEANRVFSAMRAMMRWARSRGDLDVNLMDAMRAPTEECIRDRVLTANEVRIMWATLSDANMWESTRRILRLCLITGQRVGEICGMARAELDLERGLWAIPPERTKNGREHAVPLSGLAITIIREQIAAVEALCERKERKSPPYVFPASPGRRAALTGGAIPKAVKRLESQPSAARQQSWALHLGRRTTFAGQPQPTWKRSAFRHSSSAACSITSP